MKRKIIYFGFSCLVLASSCRKDITTLNSDPKNPVTASSEALMTTAQLSFARLLSTPNVNSGIQRLLVQHWQETTYTDESNYDINTRNINRNVWNGFYLNVLKRLRESNASAASIQDAGLKKNTLAMNEILEVYAWYYLVTTFGDVPYSQSMDISNQFPKYDDAMTIYTDLLKRIATATDNLDETEASVGYADAILGGDIAKWKKFANGIRLKMAMTIADKDDALARQHAEAASANLITSSSENVQLVFSSLTPNTNPIWEDLVQSGRKDFVACATIIDSLKAFSDPRLGLFFEPNGAGEYAGIPAGDGGSYMDFSAPAARLTNPALPYEFLTFSEVSFLLAEAASRGYAVGGDAMTHYHNAIKENIMDWGGSAADADAYIATDKVNWNTAAGSWREKIGMQRWFANYNRQYDAWISYRIFDYPVLNDASEAISGFPMRFTYPVNEQNLNTTNYTNAAAAIGGDKVETKLFFDKF